MAEKYLQYAALITQQIGEMFQEESENYIDRKEFLDEDNFKAFIHAFATVAPCHLFNLVASGQKNHLEFNHMANHLVFDFSQSVESDTTSTSE